MSKTSVLHQKYSDARIVHLPTVVLFPHPENPYGVRDDPAMEALTESVKEFGVLVPGIVRLREKGGYELISGHRRKRACELAGLDSIPVIVMDLSDDEAIIQMVDSNIQRDNILPSERAKAYKMRMEAMKRQGTRTDLTSPKISAKFRSDDELGEQAGISGDTVRNYISLTNLSPELMQMVDDKKIALSPAYQIACLSPQEQAMLLETIESEQATPSLSQAQRMKKLSQENALDDTMLQILDVSCGSLSGVYSRCSPDHGLDIPLFAIPSFPSCGVRIKRESDNKNKPASPIKEEAGSAFFTTGSSSKPYSSIQLR